MVCLLLLKDVRRDPYTCLLHINKDLNLSAVSIVPDTITLLAPIQVLMKSGAIPETMKSQYGDEHFPAHCHLHLHRPLTLTISRVAKTGSEWISFAVLYCDYTNQNFLVHILLNSGEGNL
ncbi:hypothetical protein X975_22056, partial [Stegodyphus mimosarum]